MGFTMAFSFTLLGQKSFVNSDEIPLHNNSKPEKATPTKLNHKNIPRPNLLKDTGFIRKFLYLHKYRAESN